MIIPSGVVHNGHTFNQKISLICFKHDNRTKDLDLKVGLAAFLPPYPKQVARLINQATYKIVTLKATMFLVTFVRTIKHFFSPVSLDPKYSSSAGLIRNLK